MAKITIEVTSEGWSVEVETHESDRATAGEAVERIAQGFISARHQIELQTGPEYARELVEKLETLASIAHEEKNEPGPYNEEAERIHDSSSPNGATSDPENLTS